MVELRNESSDIQALVKSGYGTLDQAAFLLLQVADATRARAWLRDITRDQAAGRTSYRVTTIAHFAVPQRIALHVALSAPGLAKLGVAEDIIQDFSREFRIGMAGRDAEADGRSRRLGDLGASAPANWSWGGRQPPDVLVMLYAAAGELGALLAQVKDDLRGAFELIHELPTTQKKTATGDRLEPFGFIDGMSQPAIDWDGGQRGYGDREVYANSVRPGEFLLGHENEYGIYEDRPLLSPGRDPHGLLAAAADAPDVRDLARNGTYLVFRQLDQDVEGFWRFAADNDVSARGVSLAESMIGRRLETGLPLIKQTDGAGRSTSRDRNEFTFDGDPDGLVCPLGAHIRRANPRTADIPGGKQGPISRALRALGLLRGGPNEDLVSSARFHRIIRRGRSYGDVRTPGDANPSEDYLARAGLHFICLNANISRQFEFIQNAWLMSPTFNGMRGEADPLLGNRVDWPEGHPTSSFTIPQAAGPCRRLASLPQFVTVRGGAYFFLPSIRALRFFAALS